MRIISYLFDLDVDLACALVLLEDRHFQFSDAGQYETARTYKIIIL